MEAGAFFLFWVFLAFATIAFAYSRTQKPEGEPEGRPPASRFTRLVLALCAIGALVVLPLAVVSTASDRVPGGAGTYTDDSSESIREGRLIFRQTCASCHTLEAAGAHGVYGPNLDTLGTLDAARVLAAIESGAGGTNKMPAGLVQGEQAELVAEYVAAVAGAGRN